MRSKAPFFAFTFISLWVVLMSAGCKNDDPVEPAPATCSIEITQPQNGEVILAQTQGNDSDDLLNIRWNAAGGGKVKIDLIQGLDILAVVSSETANDGYFPWHAEPSNLDSGANYQVRITSLSDSACLDTSSEFSIINPDECSLEASSFPPTFPSEPIHEGDVLNISWDASGGSGSVVLELWRSHDFWGDEFVGSITTQNNNQSPYAWTVNVFGWQPSGSDEYYYVKVVDSQFDSCSDVCAQFKLGH